MQWTLGRTGKGLEGAVTPKLEEWVDPSVQSQFRIAQCQKQQNFCIDGQGGRGPELELENACRPSIYLQMYLHMWLISSDKVGQLL